MQGNPMRDDRISGRPVYDLDTLYVYIARLGLRLAMIRLIPVLCLCILACVPARTQDFSNKGKEFWLGYGNHQQMYAGNGQGMDVYITSDQATQAVVEIPGTGFSQTVNIIPNQVVSVTIPQNAILGTEGRSNLGIHVKADKPVVVYAHIYFASVSGATLCLPVSTLGRDYYSINFTQVAQPNLNANSYSWFFVVATEDNTTVEMIPSALTTGGRAAGVPFLETLNRGEVYQVLSNTDLTGSVIRSVNTGAGCKKIAVFSGSGRIGIGCVSPNQISSDNLFQQIYPNSTWGKKYITIPSATRPRNFYRVIRPDPTAVVTVNGAVVPAASFSNNFFYEIETTQPQIIESDKPIMVAQYFTTMGCGEATGNGDPEMIYLNPVEQTISDVTLTSMRLIQQANPQNTRHYLNVVLKNLPEVIQSFRVDGTPYAAFSPLPQDPRYAYAQITVQQGTHRLTCDSGFNAIAYGFAQTESYGYSAGTNLRDLYQFITINNVYGQVNFPAGCRNSPFRFSITFPYQPLNIRWNFNGTFADTTLVNPAHDSTWVVNGRTLYRYTINRPYQINRSGTYPINIVATNPTSDGCGGEQEIDYDLQIFDPPVADFTVMHNGCVNDSVKLFDATGTTGGRPIVRWYWDLDNQNLEATRNTVHRYDTGGLYTVKLAVITDVGCLSDTASRMVDISNLPQANFILPATICEGRVFTVTDQSTQPGQGQLGRWTWDLGDGTTRQLTDATPFSHTYASPNSYTVSLRVTNAQGCESNPYTATVTAGYQPLAAFSLPEVCLNDAFAQFTDSARVGGNTPLSYAWQFGDGAISTDQHPRHKYNAAASYAVTQVVLSNLGCSDTSVRAFTVNGAVPDAAVALQNTGPLCSNGEIILQDNSTVDFGAVTRLEIYWDANGTPAQVDIDESPARGKTYRHAYPEFGNPLTRQYTVRVRAYSGISCYSETTLPVTVLASPQIRFDSIPGMCQESGGIEFQLYSSETSGLAGQAMYSGPGVMPPGSFDPSLAGPGTHRVRYTYTANNGCVAFRESQIIVYPTPVVDAGPDRTVLEGGFITINATARGAGLQFRWQPGTGLSDSTLLTPQASPSVDTRYRLAVTSANGCSAGDDVFVKVLLKPTIPNTFTPNGDGYNDRWEIRSLDSYPGCVVEVYNTAGQIVFRSVGYSHPWDGTMNGRALPAGTYYYVIDAKNGRSKVAGYVTLLR
jgi:gliding motility-associated-like protein